MEVEGGIGFDYISCFYHDYMREKGAPEFTPIFVRSTCGRPSAFLARSSSKGHRPCPLGGISATSVFIAEIEAG